MFYKRNNIKYIAKFLVFNLSAALCLFLLLEFILRIAHPEIKLSGTEQKLLLDSVYYDSPGLNPNSKGLSNGIIKSVDNYGFWKYDNGPRRVKDKILFLGDSVTMGIGIESDSTFAGRINSTLDNKVVLNSALIGYSNRDYYNIIRKIFVDNRNELEISSVYLFWCLNDIYSDHFIGGPGFGNTGIINNFVSWLRKNTKLYHWLKNLYSDRSKDYFLYDKKYYANGNEKLDSSVENISRINKILIDHNVSLKIILLPYEYQLRVNDNRPQKKLIEKLIVHNIITLDLMDNLNIETSNYKVLYLFGDGIHLSNLGHKMISEILLDKSIIPRI